MRTSRRALAMAGAFPLALTWALPAGAQTADNTPTPSASSTPAGIDNLNNGPFWNVHPYLQRSSMAEAEVTVSWQAPRAAVWLRPRGGASGGPATPVLRWRWLGARQFLKAIHR